MFKIRLRGIKDEILLRGKYMRNKLILTLIIFILVGSMTSPVFAQPGFGMESGMMEAVYNAIYIM